MLEQWIDDVSSLFSKLSNGSGGSVRAYKLYELAELPEKLTIYPCAITYTDDVVMTMPDSGPNVDMWRGVTELHVVPGKKRSDYPKILPYFNRIRGVFAIDRTLGGKVQYCKLTVEGPSIEGPVLFSPDTEIMDQGLIVHWVVRERLS